MGIESGFSLLALAPPSSAPALVIDIPTPVSPARPREANVGSAVSGFMLLATSCTGTSIGVCSSWGWGPFSTKQPGRSRAGSRPAHASGTRLLCAMLIDPVRVPAGLTSTLQSEWAAVTAPAAQAQRAAPPAQDAGGGPTESVDTGDSEGDNTLAPRPLVFLAALTPPLGVALSHPGAFLTLLSVSSRSLIQNHRYKLRPSPAILTVLHS